MTKKRVLVRALIFILLFILGWVVLQDVLSYNWNRNELLTSRYEDYASEEDGMTDVIFFGASTTHADISPVAIWESSGITSYNMGTSNQIPFLSYYQFLYLMELHKPKVIVMDFSGISIDKDVDNDASRETIYRKMTDTMPDRRIKWMMEDDICTRFKSQKRIDYYLTLLRYHDRWEELASIDFKDGKVAQSYEPWTRGAGEHGEYAEYDWPENFFSKENNEAAELYIEYYQKMADICKEEGIEVLVFLAPKLALRPGDLKAAKAFADENGFRLLTIASRKSMESVGLNPKEDFYDEAHLNLKGQRKLSDAMGRVLQSYYNLPDHRGDEKYSKWSEYVESYHEWYDELSNNMIKVEE